MMKMLNGFNEWFLDRSIYLYCMLIEIIDTLEIVDYPHQFPCPRIDGYNGNLEKFSLPRNHSMCKIHYFCSAVNCCDINYNQFRN